MGRITVIWDVEYWLCVIVGCCSGVTTFITSKICILLTKCSSEREEYFERFKSPHLITFNGCTFTSFYDKSVAIMYDLFLVLSSISVIGASAFS